jgi:hypothetical protein
MTILTINCYSAIYMLLLCRQVVYRSRLFLLYTLFIPVFTYEFSPQKRFLAQTISEELILITLDLNHVHCTYNFSGPSDCTLRDHEGMKVKSDFCNYMEFYTYS